MANRKRRHTTSSAETAPDTASTAEAALGEEDTASTATRRRSQRLTHTPPGASPITREMLHKQLEPESDDSGEGGYELDEQHVLKRAKIGKAHSPRAERCCPYCSKILGSAHALSYHVSNFVCRPTEGPKKQSAPSTTVRRKRFKKSAAKGGKQWQRIRGAAEDRTCEHCNRIFTSVLGKQYHQKHMVCQAASKPPFYTLASGERFVTKFGVVEVVKDDRATPSAEMLEKTNRRAWNVLKARWEKRMSKALLPELASLRARRYTINAQYHSESGGAIDTKSNFRAYFGVDPRTLKPFGRSVLPGPAPCDPTILPGSYPERIVECKWIPDERQVIGGERLEPTESRKNPCNMNLGTLFLQRRLLTEPYNPSVTVYECEGCGERFTNLPGQRYHLNGKICKSKKAKVSSARIQNTENVCKTAARLISEHQVPGHSNVRRIVSRDIRNKATRRNGMGMYPEVLLALGFQLVKEDLRITDNRPFPASANPETLGDLETHDIEPVHRPAVLVERLRQELADQQRQADDQKYGGMYAEVFGALQYKSSRSRRGRAANGGKRKPPPKNDNDISTRKRRRRSLKPPPPPKALPPIIDTRALTDEIASGRYPSIVRHRDNDHKDVCELCKEGGDLLCCDFCRNVEHMSCIRKRFTIKDPEPQDDFLCHKCIQTILARRARAEKRRLKKQQKENSRGLQGSHQSMEIERGKEYEFLAARGQDVSELIELLEDAQTRLRQSLATAKLNTLRRKILDLHYSDKMS